MHRLVLSAVLGGVLLLALGSFALADEGSKNNADGRSDRLPGSPVRLVHGLG